MFGDRGDPRFELLKLRLELRVPKRQLFAARQLWQRLRRDIRPVEDDRASQAMRHFRLGEWRQVSEDSTPGLAGGRSR